MDFFIKETNIRAGNRGGKNLFNWDDVRLLPNRDRQSYLGSTQALGLMDRGGKWYRRDWWTHYNNKVNVYGHKDKLNNRQALLDEQKEIREKDKERLLEFIYGKKKKNNNINIGINDGESVKGSINKIEINNNANNSKINDLNDLSRPGLGMKNQINFPQNEKILEKDIDKKSENQFLGKKTKNNIKDDDKRERKDINSNKDKNSRSHHHHHHRHHHHHNKSKSRSKSSSRNKKINSKIEIIHKKSYREDFKD